MAKMVTLLITFLFVLALLAVAVYFWQKPASSNKIETLTPPPGRGLFIDGILDGVAQTAVEADSEAIANAGLQRPEILGRAKGGEKSTLQEAQNTARLDKIDDRRTAEEIKHELLSGDPADRRLDEGAH